MANNDMKTLAGEYSLDTAGRYEVLLNLSTAPGFAHFYIGKDNSCRFCGVTGPKCFKKVAHTLPEFLGNKGIFSNDECDACNALFSIYEGALAEMLKPFLTLGGIKGKKNDIPQTGRSNSSNRIRRDETGKIPHISIHTKCEN